MYLDDDGYDEDAMMSDASDDEAVSFSFKSMCSACILYFFCLLNI